MSQPAARISDMHTCPMQTPAVPPVPHVGGPILPPGEPRTLIGGLPAARMGDQCVCVGPPDVIVKGSPTVMIGGRPAARLGDSTAHGGVIVAGYPQVLIGETGSGTGSPGGGAAAMPAAQRVALQSAAESGAPFCEQCERARRAVAVPPVPGDVRVGAQRTALRAAAQDGAAFCEQCEQARRALDPVPVPGGGDPVQQRTALRDAADEGAPFVGPSAPASTED